MEQRVGRGGAINILGHRFGRLTVISRAQKGDSNGARWICQCDCGNEKEVSAKWLRVGKYISCGCLIKEVLREQSSKRFESLGHTGGYRDAINQYKNGARKREIPWELTDEYAQELLSSDCHYCGHPPSQNSRNKVLNPVMVGGIDRKDSSGPYSVDNCLPACKSCNISKQGMSYDEFISMCRAVTAHQDSQFSLLTIVGDPSPQWSVM